MGCTSSKETTPKNQTQSGPDAEDKPQPIRKIRTNFSDVNYTDPSTGRRDTVYAPSEVPRQPSVVPEVPGEHRASAAVAPAEGTISETEVLVREPSGAVSGDGLGNGIVGGQVVAEERKAEEGASALKAEVPWDALSPGSSSVHVN